MLPEPAAVTVIDCTLRDGGYYNRWDFDLGIVDSYLRATGAAGLDVVEIGFRGFGASSFLGPFAYSTDEFLDTLKLPDGPSIGVMVNASELVTHDDGPEGAVDRLFVDEASSPVQVVRIAAHLREIGALRPACERLRDLGYTLGLNLMQVSRAQPAQLEELAAEIATWDAANVLYFADSLGSMSEVEVRTTLDALRAGWSGPLGVHAHDNRGRALQNTLAAADWGATWLDATVLGMGRGAGNARTDFLLFELAQAGLTRYRAESLLEVTEVDFRSLQQEYGWGTNLLYFLSAAYGVHPTYVQMLQGDDRYDAADAVAALEALREVEGHSFSPDRLRDALEAAPADPEGTWDASNRFAGRDVLVLAGGPSAHRHAGGLAGFIQREDPVVLCLNSRAPIATDLVDAFVACHPTRILLETARLAELDRPLILPLSTLDPAVVGQLEGREVWDYGLGVRNDEFEVGATGCTLPRPLAMAYAMAVAVAAGARRILLAGVDGYGAGDARQEEMAEVFATFAEVAPDIPVVAVTPTTYAIAQSSIFAPEA